MLVACRLASLSALEGHYAGVRVCAQFGPTQSLIAANLRVTPSDAKPLQTWAGGVLARVPQPGPPGGLNENGLHWQLFGAQGQERPAPPRLWPYPKWKV